MLRTICRLLLPILGGLLVLSVLPLTAGQSAGAADPPVINPFGPKPSVREDAVPGYVEMSDGTVHPGQIYLTRDKRLKIYDEKLQRQREIPLRAVKQIECRVKKQWMEKEWKFKEAAKSEKMYTGRTYPAREYLHVITLRDKRTITGPVSAIVYVQPSRTVAGEPGGYPARPKPQRYLLHKRHKGKIGDDLKSLVYVKLIKLGYDALAEGRKKAAERRAKKGKLNMRKESEF
ncbi:MAG: hypothetical protein ACYSWU_06570 [Planctomycetota bacterium]|jgi:hypothetical protein